MSDTIKNFCVAAVVIGSVVFGMKSCVESEWWQEPIRRQEAQRKADRQPRVIREADGCKVYAFKDGDRWHYFTRCPASTTTEATYTVSKACGKSTCTEVRSEVIETTNAQTRSN